MVTITWLFVGILVNGINCGLLHHTRWVATITAERCLTTWTSFCLQRHWHEHQAPDDALHMWFHFCVDRDFHHYWLFMDFFNNLIFETSPTSRFQFFFFISIFSFFSVCLRTQTLFSSSFSFFLFILTESFSRFAALFLLNFEPIWRRFHAAFFRTLLLLPSLRCVEHEYCFFKQPEAKNVEKQFVWVIMKIEWRIEDYLVYMWIRNCGNFSVMSWILCWIL